MKRVIVTGGAGFIGSCLVKLLLKKKYIVLNLDKLSYAGTLHNLDEVRTNKNYSFIKVDICDQKRLEKIILKFKPHAVFHVAAETHVDNSIENPRKFIKNNIVGTFSLLEILRRYDNLKKVNNLKIIYVSTDEVYGSINGNKKFTEKSQIKPNNPYSASKASGQHLARSWFKTFKLPIIVTNCSNNFGPFQHKEKFIPKIILSCFKNKQIPIYGNGKNIRDWIYVEDHCLALITILNKGVVGEVYNIGNNYELKNIDIVKIICKTIDKQIGKKTNSFNLVKYINDRKGHDFRYAINSNKLKKIGWKPKNSFEKNIQKTINWYFKNIR